MASYANDSILDAELNYIVNNATDLYLCSSLPATLAEATTTYALGIKPSVSIGAPTDGITGAGGRRSTVAAITDGSVTAGGLATHYAIVSGTELLVAKSLPNSQQVYAGNIFTLNAFDLINPDAA